MQSVRVVHVIFRTSTFGFSGCMHAFAIVMATSSSSEAVKAQGPEPDFLAPGDQEDVDYTYSSPENRSRSPERWLQDHLRGGQLRMQEEAKERAYHKSRRNLKWLRKPKNDWTSPMQAIGRPSAMARCPGQMQCPRTTEMPSLPPAHGAAFLVPRSSLDSQLKWPESWKTASLGELILPSSAPETP